MSTDYGALMDNETTNLATGESRPRISKYGELMDKEIGAQTRAAAQVLGKYIKASPDKAARINELSKTTNLAPSFVERNYEEIDRRDQIAKLQDALAQSPILKRQMADPAFAAIAHDDVKNLSGLEKITNALKDTASAGYSGLVRASEGVTALAQMPFDIGAEAVEPLVGGLLPANPLRQAAQELSEYRQRLGATADAYMPDADGLLGRGFYSGIGSLANNLIMMPLAFLPGGQAAALTGMSFPIAGTMYGQAKDKGLSTGVAIPYAASQGTIEYVFNRLPLHELMKSLGAGSSLAKTLLQQTALEVPREQAIQFLEDLNDFAVVNKDATLSDFIKQRPESAALNLVSTLVGVGGQTTVMHGINRIASRNDQKASQAEDVANALQGLVDLSKSSALLQRSPESFEQFVEQASQDGPVNAIYIDPQTLLESGYAQSVIEASPSVAEQIDQAQVANTPIHIPVSEFAAKIAPIEGVENLLDHIKTDPNGFTRAEAQDYLANKDEELKSAVEKAFAEQADQDAFMQSRDKVKQTIQNELKATGRFTDEAAEVNAMLVSTRTAVRAAQLGITPEQMFERQRLNAVGERLVDGQIYSQGGAPNVDEFAPDGFTRIWHGGNEGVTEILGDAAPGNLFGGVFGSQDESAARSHGDGTLYYMDVPDEKILTQQALDYHVEHDIAMAALRKAVPMADELDLGIAYQAVIEDDAYNVAPQDLMRIFGGGEDDAVWAAQRARGEVAKELGYQAVEMDDEHGTSYLVLPGVDIKPAAGSHNVSGPNHPNILHQSEPQNLFVGHNLTPEGILAAQELGGLAAPSIAIARSDLGFDEYGSVTLLADPSFLNDRKIRTFDADIYSPRQPRPVFEIDNKSFNDFIKSLDPNNYDLAMPDINTLEGQDGPDSFLRSDAVREAYLREVGKLPRMYNAKVDPAIRKAAKLNLSEFEMEADQRVVDLASKMIRDSLQERNIAREKAKQEGRKLIVRSLYESVFFNADSTLKIEHLRRFARDVTSYIDSKGKDIGRYKTDLNAKFRSDKLSKDFEKWASEQFNSLVKNKRIFKGFTKSGNRKYIPYTLDNVVKEMTTQLQSGENFNYGAGNVRSRYATELKTLEQIKTKRSQIISAEDFATIKEQANKALSEALEKLKPFYKYDADGWNYDNDASSALAEGQRGIREAFKLTPESRKIIDDLTGYLSALPTEYFEAKAQRAVQFSEFDTAVVPKGMSKDALQVLKDAGLKIKTYDPGVDGARAKAISEQTKLLFQGKQGPRGAFSPEANTIALLKNADLSTFLHEAGHYFFESDIELAGDIVRKSRLGEDISTGEQEVLNDVSVLLRYVGVQGQLEDQLLQWHNLEFEEKRSYHELVAESFERYLFEGKAPSIELQSYFQKFRAWMVNVYKSIKDFLNQNPSAGALSEEVRTVFDRMLATTQEIEIAEQARSMLPLFRTQAEAEKAGMTQEEFVAYNNIGLQSTGEAMQDLQAKGLRDLQWLRNARNREIKKLQKQAKELRREVKIEARREILNEPVYKAWSFLTRRLDEQDQLPKKQTGKSKSVDPAIDPLIVAIAKLGGIKKDEVVSQWGVNPAEVENPVFGKPVLRSTDGLTIEGMREALEELGYLDNNHTDPNWNPNELEEKFDDALRGEDHYSIAVDYDLLNNGERAGEDLDLSQVSAGRLDLQALRDMGFNEDQVSLLKAYRMTSSNGLHPDIVADLLGTELESGGQMVGALLKAEPIADAINARAEQIMLERHGELATPEDLERAADAAIHNDARVRMVLTETNILAKAIGEKKVLKEAADALAKQMIARLPIRELKPSIYANAAARAGKLAAKAQRAGDIRLAAAEKRNQLLNTIAAKEAHKAREQAQKDLKYLNKFKNEGSRKNINIDYLDQVDSLLEKFDLRKRSQKEVDRAKRFRTVMQSMINDGKVPDIALEVLPIRERQRFLSEVMQRDDSGDLIYQDEAAQATLLAEYIDRSETRSYIDVTVEEMRGLVDTVKQIEHLGRHKNRLLTDQAQAEYETVRDEIVDSINENAVRSQVDNDPNTKLGKAAQKLRAFETASLTISSIARILDGNKENGIFWNTLVKRANGAATMETEMVAQATAELAKILDPVIKLGGTTGKGTYFESIGRSLNREQIFVIALNYGNEGNIQRLLDGEGWTQAQILPILKTITKKEWQAVQKVWGFIEAYRPLIAAKERRVYGKEPDWIEPQPFSIVTNDGDTVHLKGGYYPVKYHPKRSVGAARNDAAQQAKEMQQGAYTSATPRRSFTKPRVAEVKGRPLMYSLSGLFGGVNEIIHDLSWHEYLIDANKIMKSTSIGNAIINRHGAEYLKAITNWLNAVAVGNNKSQTDGEKVIGFIRQSVSVAGLGFNVVSAAIQPLGLTQSYRVVGAHYMNKAISEYAASPKKVSAMVNELSPMMNNRARTKFRELNELTNKVQQQSKGKEFINNYAYSFMLLAERAATVPTWLGRYHKALNEGSTQEQAIALADQAVIDTQGGGQITDLTAFERGSPAVKLFTVFYNFMKTPLNLTLRRIYGEGIDTPAKKAKLAVDVLMYFSVPATLDMLLREIFKIGDDDDKDLSEWARKLAAANMSYAMGSVFMLRELSEVSKIITGSGRAFDYQGPAGVRLIPDTQRLISQFAKIPDKGMDAFDLAFAKAVVNAAGVAFGLPSSQINRLLTGGIAIADGKTVNPASLLFGYHGR